MHWSIVGQCKILDQLDDGTAAIFESHVQYVYVF